MSQKRQKSFNHQVPKSHWLTDAWTRASRDSKDFRGPKTSRDFRDLRDLRDFKIPQTLEILETPEAPEPILEQEEISDLTSPDESKIASSEDFGKPSKVLTVRGIRPNVSMKQLFERLAKFYPVNVRRYVPTSAHVEFVDIEAATKALNAMHGTFVGGRIINCLFKSDVSEENRTDARTVASEPPVGGYKEDLSSTHGMKQHQDALVPPTPITTEAVTEIPTESIKQDVVKAPTKSMKQTVIEIPTESIKRAVSEASTESTRQAIVETSKDVTTEAVLEPSTETTADRLSLSPDLDLPDPTAPTRTLSKMQKKDERVLRIRKVFSGEPAESTIDAPSNPTKDQEVTTAEIEMYDGLQNSGDTDDRPIHDSSTSQVTYNDFETDDVSLLDEPTASDGLGSRPLSWAVLMKDYPNLMKRRRPDGIKPEISQLSTIPVPVTHAYWLPYPTQIKILRGLQTSAERVCFQYLQRKYPEVLEGTPTQWGIKSPHELELNQYISILRTLRLSDSKATLKGAGSKTVQSLGHSMIRLRHAAVHRSRHDINALRFWAVDTCRLAELLGDPEAAKQFSALRLYLRAQYRNISTEKMKAERKLLNTLKEVTAKRAELERVEREAMDAFEEDHKQLHKAIDANIPLNPEFGINLEETSSTKPASGIFGRIKDWFGA
ncbi:unnamed protein product [Aureobasidium vineae]|uniref:RRM domain-containing protein n=1 Tax=Aureobasidium vineae TaxID=2773715 RepID=A0A9N8JI00_9PEZI|nr:unnamed protein product [Aureobasidium vineae]